MKITFHDSFEDMLEEMRKGTEAADAMVTEEQRRYRPGDIVVSDPGYGFPVFHVILDIEKVVKESLFKGGSDRDGIYTLDLYREPHMRNYCFTKSYSEACPEGELGDIHRSIGIGKISRDVFEEIRANGYRIEEVDEE